MSHLTGDGIDSVKSTRTKRRGTGKKGTPAHKPYTCDFCDKTFLTDSIRKQHLMSHTGEKPFTCDVCDKSFSRAWDCNRHIQTHSGQKPYACDLCDGRFAQPSHLKEHVQGHSGEKNFKCEFCDKTFSRASARRKHMKTHSGQRPYMCDKCDKTFVHSDRLKEHLHLHTGERPFICEICESRFSRASGRRRHLRTHTAEKPYNCDFCDKKFKFLSSQKKHVKIHMEGKCYKCDFCDKSFLEAFRCEEHAMAHTGEKPFKCEVCEKSFSRSQNLVRHIKTHIEVNSSVVFPETTFLQNETSLTSCTVISEASISSGFSDSSSNAHGDCELQRVAVISSINENPVISAPPPSGYKQEGESLVNVKDENPFLLESNIFIPDFVTVNTIKPENVKTEVEYACYEEGGFNELAKLPPGVKISNESVALSMWKPFLQAEEGEEMWRGNESFSCVTPDIRSDLDPRRSVSNRYGIPVLRIPFPSKVDEVIEGEKPISFRPNTSNTRSDVDPLLT